MTTRILIRPFNYTNQYQLWLLKDYQNTLGRLKQTFESELFGDGSKEAIFKRYSAEVVFLWQPSESQPDETNFIIDLFRNILVQKQYYCYNADERNETYDGGHMLTIHRYHMRPLDKNNTHFGNITLESGFTSFRSIALRITADYTDSSHYSSFETMMESLLSGSYN